MTIATTIPDTMDYVTDEQVFPVWLNRSSSAIHKDGVKKERMNSILSSRPALLSFFFLSLWLATGSPVCGASLDDRLAKARLELEIGMATEQRILTELNHYRSSEDASPDRIALYETYLDRVRQLTEEKRKVVQQLEQARRRSLPASNAGTPDTDLPPPSLDIPEDQELDELRALQRELDQSIAAFDDMLLTENELARVQSDLKMKQLAQEAAQAARNLREGDGGGGEGTEESETGMESGTSSSGDGDETGENSEEGGMEGIEGEAGEASQDPGSKETGGGQDRSKRASKSSKGQGGEASAGQSQQTTVSQDDDIVARQLREAAENETDPVLKEKLWKEYNDYKKGL